VLPSLTPAIHGPIRALGNVYAPNAVEKTHTLSRRHLSAFQLRRTAACLVTSDHRSSSHVFWDLSRPTVSSQGGSRSPRRCVLAGGDLDGAEVYPWTRRFKPLGLSAGPVVSGPAATPNRRTKAPLPPSPKDGSIAAHLADLRQNRGQMASGPANAVRSSAATSAFCRAQRCYRIDMTAGAVSGASNNRTSQGFVVAP